MHELDLDLARIEQARKVIDPVFLDSPQYTDPLLSEALGTRVLVKLETANPLRSFKGRGAENLLQHLGTAEPLVTVSMGNFGQALAYAGSRRGASVTVFVPETVGAVKQRRMSALGATVVPVSGDIAGAVDAAREFVAAHPEHRFVQDGEEVAVVEGAATIGLELLTARPDTVVVPVGDGALANGIGYAIKQHDPDVRIVGVCATGAPSMALSWQSRERITTAAADTFAEGIAIRSPIEASLRRMYAVVDDMVLVDDTAMGAAVELAARTLGVLLEPAGAAALAAIAEHDLRAGRVAVVLTGANPNEADLPRP